MKWRPGFGGIASLLLAVLCVSAALLTLGSVDRKTDPDAVSFAPSGAAALVEILRRQGYSVQSDSGTRVHISPDDLAIALSTASAPEPDRIPQGDQETQKPFSKSLMRHFNAGGKALIVTLPDDFRMLSKTQNSTIDVAKWALDDFEQRPNSEFLINLANNLDLGPWDLEYPWLEHTGLPVFVGRVRSPLFLVFGVGKGACGLIPSGIGVCNRYIKQNDNAKFLVSCIALLAKPGGRIVFLEAAHGGGSEPSLPETLGTWAVAAWWQSIALFLVIVFTLGKRFGLPDEERHRESGSKDLVDALSNIMFRAGATDLALSSLLHEADRQIRAKLRLPMDAPAADRDKRIPESLSSALRQMETLSQQRISTADAAKVSVKLEAELAAFFGASHIQRLQRR